MTTSSTRLLLAHGRHTIELDYFQGPRVQIALQLFWTPPGGQELLLQLTDETS